MHAHGAQELRIGDRIDRLRPWCRSSCRPAPGWRRSARRRGRQARHQRELPFARHAGLDPASQRSSSQVNAHAGQRRRRTAQAPVPPRRPGCPCCALCGWSSQSFSRRTLRWLAFQPASKISPGQRDQADDALHRDVEGHARKDSPAHPQRMRFLDDVAGKRDADQVAHHGDQADQHLQPDGEPGAGDGNRAIEQPRESVKAFAQLLVCSPLLRLLS